jgi:Kdo2-lipid IVA lauroyltransferase/acyltransferase
MNSGFSTNIGIFFLKVMAKFPFWFIYFLSDLFYWIVYYLVGYRKKVVVENLKNAFPEKSEIEINAISKKYFRHFADLTLETIKMRGMKPADFEERMKVTNADLVNRYFDKGKSVMVLTMHYNNWEWGTYLSVHLKHYCLAVYKPLQNILFDRFMNKTRSKFGTQLVKNDQILRRVLQAEKQNKPVFIWLAGDQTPPEFHKFWFRFLHQDAMFYPGPAFISKRFNQPVFFQKTEKTERGKYKITFELLFENPAQFSETEIIKTYIQRMEEVIREQPEFYLWSHKRWKHKRPAELPLQS